MLYHAWPPDAVGSELPGRNPWLSEVLFHSRRFGQRSAADGGLPT
jgi:hypothetical protein